MGRQGKSIHTIAAVLPSPNDHLGFSEAVEDLQPRAPVPEFRSEMPASSQAGARQEHRADRTSIWRTMAIICSGLNLFSGMGVSLVPGQLFTRERDVAAGDLRSTPSDRRDVAEAPASAGRIARRSSG